MMMIIFEHDNDNDKFNDEDIFDLWYMMMDDWFTCSVTVYGLFAFKPMVPWRYNCGPKPLIIIGSHIPKFTLYFYNVQP